VKQTKLKSHVLPPQTPTKIIMN